MPHSLGKDPVQFDIGRVVATLGAVELLDSTETYPLQLLVRHVLGDWGEVGEDSVAANEESIRLQYGTVLSCYTVGAHQLFLVTTLADAGGTCTTFMLPEEW